VLLGTVLTVAVEPLFAPDKNHHSQDLVLFYSSKTWVLTKRTENQLLVFERKVLQTICGLKIEIGVYKRRYNHEKLCTIN
jgi:hypothetical protein